MYNVTLYYDTGFNAMNVPGSPALLESMTHDTFDAIDILQGGLISSVSVRANWTAVSHADYMKISNSQEIWHFSSSPEIWYYSITGVAMTSPDVAKVFITLDPFTTIGGVSNIAGFLDGIVERCHIAKADDVFGAYDEDDPYLIPSKVLEVENGGIKAIVEAGDTLVESTVDLVAMASAQDGIEYLDSSTSKSCVVPEVEHLPVGEFTQVVMPSVGQYRPPITLYFKYENADVKEGIRRARSLGVESAILNCWNIPADATAPVNNGKITTVTSSFHTESSGLNYEFATVNNKRILYGNLCKYFLVSIASGDAISFNPEDIYGDTTAPLIKYITDPRPNGTPSFRFNYYKGDSSASGFFQNCIHGLPNPNAPLVYYDKSGSQVDTMRFNTQVAIKKEDAYVSQMKSFESDVAGVVGGFSLQNLGGGTVINMARGVSSIAARTLHGAEADLSTPEMSLYSESSNIERQFKNQLASETQEFKLSQSIVVPTINFPRSETIRDFVGNGVLCYRVKPSAFDCQKFDKILSMFGYRHTTAPDLSMMTNRSKFNYLKIAGASIKTVNGSNIPKWLRDAVATQLSASGIRIWHVKPDPTAYTDGSNV